MKIQKERKRNTLLILGVRIIGFIVLMLVVLYMLIQQPFIQQYIAEKLTSIISEKLQTNIYIGNVKVEFFDAVSLGNLQIEDRNGDTLVYTKIIDVDIGFFSLLKKKILLEQVTIKGLVINANEQSDSTFNFSFLAENWNKSDEKAKEDSTDPGWDAQLKSVILKQFRFKVQQESGIGWIAQGGSLDIRINSFNKKLKSIDLESVDVQNTMINQLVRTTPESSIIKQKKALSSLLPSSLWSLSIGKVNGKNNNIVMGTPDSKTTPGLIDFKHLSISNFYLDINDLTFNNDRLVADVQHLNLDESSGFSIEDFAANITLNPTKLNLAQVSLKTPYSSVKSSLSLSLNTASQKVNGDLIFASEIDKSYVGMRDLALLIPNISTRLNTDLTDQIFLQGSLKGSKTGLNLDDIEIKAGKYANFKGKVVVTNFDQPTKTGFFLKLLRFQSSHRALNTLFRNVQIPDELEDLGDFTLSGVVEGDVDNLQLKSLVLKSSIESSLTLSGRIKNVSDTDRLSYDLDIDHLYVNMDKMIPQIGDSSLVFLKPLGHLTYAGQLAGNKDSVMIKGKLTSNLGDVTSDLQLMFDQDSKLDNYKGNISLEKFDVGKITTAKDIGEVSMDLQMDGSGVDLKKMEAELLLYIRNITYNHQVYENIRYAGNIKKGLIKGKMDVDDHLIKGHFSGMIDLSDSIPLTDMTVELTKLNLKDLNLSEELLNLELKSKIKLVGKDLDELTGNVSIAHFHLFNDSTSYRTNDIELTANKANNGLKEILLSSEFVDARLDGKFKWAHLPVILKNHFSQILPSVKTTSITNQIPELDESTILDDSLKMEITLKNYKPFALWGISDLPEAKEAHIVVNVDEARDKISIKGEIRNFLFRDLAVKSVNLESTVIDRSIITNLQLDSTTYKSIHIPITTLASRIQNDVNVFSLDLSQDSAFQYLQLSGFLSKQKEKNQLSFDEAVIVNNEQWLVPEGNQILWNPNGLFINQFSIQKNGKSVAINGNLNFDGLVQNEKLTVEFSEFPVSSLSNVLKSDLPNFEGIINGNIFVKDNLSKPSLNAELLISKLHIDDIYLGDVTINAIDSSGAETTSIQTILASPEDLIEVQGTVNKSSGALNLNTRIEKLSLASIDPFVKDLFKDSKGSLKGKLKITGTASLPNIQGDIFLHNIETDVQFAKTRYYIDDQVISFSENEIGIPQLKIFDDEKGHFLVNGKISHKRFQNFVLDLSVATENFKFINTTQKDNELFFGNLFLWLNGTVKGPLVDPEVTLAARTRPNTSLSISAFSSIDPVYQDDYVIFLSPEQYKNKEDLPVQKKSEFPLSLRLNLELTDDAKIQFIIDPDSGDKLICQGQSNLTIISNTTGDVEVYGQYILSKGQYDFSYSEFVKRQFDIQPGSTVTFNGDLTMTTFNASANYRTQASLYELIKNETSLLSSEILVARRKTPIDVSLAISGQLKSPEINFNIILPHPVSGPVGNMMEEKLQSLRRNPNELNNQVFGLLLFNSFMLSGGSSELSGFSIGQAGATQGLSSVSSLFTNQLNQLAQKHIKGVEVNFDIDAYQTNKNDYMSSSLVTKVGVGVSKQLLGDRLKIQATGNLDIEDVDQNNTYTSIAGNYLLEYKLTEDGQYILRVYRQDNNNTITGEKSSKNSVGIMFKKTFDDRSN